MAKIDTSSYMFFEIIIRNYTTPYMQTMVLFLLNYFNCRPYRDRVVYWDCREYPLITVYRLYKLFFIFLVLLNHGQLQVTEVEALGNFWFSCIGTISIVCCLFLLFWMV